MTDAEVEGDPGGREFLQGVGGCEELDEPPADSQLAWNIFSRVESLLANAVPELKAGVS